MTVGYLGLIHVNRKAYSFTGRKILGAATFPQCYFDRGMSGASEKPWIQACKPQGKYFISILVIRGIFTYIMFYMGKLRKTSKSACYRDLNPPFCANFVPYPMRLNATDFLSHIFNIEIFVLWKGGPEKLLKLGMFYHFHQK